MKKKKKQAKSQKASRREKGDYRKKIKCFRLENYPWQAKWPVKPRTQQESCKLQDTKRQLEASN